MSGELADDIIADGLALAAGRSSEKFIRGVADVAYEQHAIEHYAEALAELQKHRADRKNDEAVKLDDGDGDQRPHGVSVNFFCDSIKSLVRAHGSRTAGPWFEEFRAALERAEQLYLSGRPVEAKKKPRSKMKPSKRKAVQ